MFTILHPPSEKRGFAGYTAPKCRGDEGMGRSESINLCPDWDLQNPGFFISTLPRPEHRGSSLSSGETGSIQAGFSLRKSVIFPIRGPHRGFPEHFLPEPPKQAGPALMKRGDPGLLCARMDRTGSAGTTGTRLLKSGGWGQILQTLPILLTSSIAILGFQMCQNSLIMSTGLHIDPSGSVISNGSVTSDEIHHAVCSKKETYDFL
jgi:hypothetical protein